MAVALDEVVHALKWGPRAAGGDAARALPRRAVALVGGADGAGRHAAGADNLTIGALRRQEPGGGWRSARPALALVGGLAWLILGEGAQSAGRAQARGRRDGGWRDRGGRTDGDRTDGGRRGDGDAGGGARAAGIPDGDGARGDDALRRRGLSRRRAHLAREDAAGADHAAPTTATCG